jgi:aspartate aminotransferase-like enzyme
MEKFDTLTALSALEIGLAEQGYKFEFGKAVGAAAGYFADR